MLVQDARLVGDIKVMEFRLASAEMVYTPGLVAWAVNGAKFAKDRPVMIDVLKGGWPMLTDNAIDNLLAGNYSLDNDVVVVEG